MEPENNGNSLTREQLIRISQIIEAIKKKDAEKLYEIIDIPLENPEIFWKSVDEVYEKIRFENEDLRPHMRVMHPNEDELGMISVFLESTETHRRDILLIVFMKEENENIEIFLGTIYDKSIYTPDITGPSEFTLN